MNWKGSARVRWALLALLFVSTVINYLEYSLDPVLAAVNVASLLFVLAVIFVFEKIGGFSAQIHGGSK